VVVLGNPQEYTGTSWLEHLKGGAIYGIAAMSLIDFNVRIFNVPDT